MCRRLAINFIHKRFNCLDDYWFDSIGQVKKSTFDFFCQYCVPQVKIGLCVKFDQENLIGSSKIKNYGKLLKLETRVLKLTIYGKLGVNEQLLPCPLFYMIKTPNQVGLNMDFILLPPSFKEVPRLSHLDHLSPIYGYGKWSVSNSSICPKT